MHKSYLRHSFTIIQVSEGNWCSALHQWISSVYVCPPPHSIGAPRKNPAFIATSLSRIPCTPVSISLNHGSCVGQVTTIKLLNSFFNDCLAIPFASLSMVYDMEVDRISPGVMSAARNTALFLLVLPFSWPLPLLLPLPLPQVPPLPLPLPRRLQLLFPVSFPGAHLTDSGWHPTCWPGKLAPVTVPFTTRGVKPWGPYSTACTRLPQQSS